MSDILEKFEQYISTNKEVLSVLPVNTKKNRAKYVEKVDEFIEEAEQINKSIWNTIQDRYDSILDVVENPKISELSKSIESIKDIELFNELNTPFEKLGFDKINHSLDCFFEGNLELVNKNIKLFLEKFRDYGIILTENDFHYSQYTNDYMKVFFEETSDGSLTSEKLKKTFETIYWKCPDIVIHIELNMRYLYNINSKKFEKELKERNDRTLKNMTLDKNGLVRRYFELNKELIKLKRLDSKYIIEKFTNGEWKSKDFNDKEMANLYNRICSLNYYSLSPEKQTEVNKSIGKLLNTLQEYNTYKKYKYILDDLKERCKNKDSFKTQYDEKLKAVNKKEQALLKENENNKKIIKRIKNPLFIFFKKKLERKVYEFPVASNTQIKEIKKLYQELDDAGINLRIVEFVDDTCTLKYMLKIAVSFYTYVYNRVKEQYIDDPDINVDGEVQELIDFINQPYKVMLNNIKLIEESDITSIIANRYKILNLNVEKVDLEENLDELMQCVEKIVDYNNIQRSDVSMTDIEFVENVKPIVMKKQ